MENQGDTSTSGGESADASPLTLSSLLSRLRFRLRPALLAYLVALLFVCLLAWRETSHVGAIEANLIQIAPDSKIPDYRRVVIPDPDGMRWVIYSQNAWRDSSVRLPHVSHEDGYPEGRSVGWSSPPMWWLQGLGYVRHLATGEDMLVAIDRAAPHYNTVIWVFAALFMGAMCVSAFGWRGAFVLPLLYSTLVFTKYGIFSPDHHLWILLSALGTLVCLAAPYAREGACRQWLWFSGAACFTAFGLWISAPSQALVVFGIFLGVLFLPSEAAAKVDSFHWRLYGYLSAALALLAGWWEFHPLIQYRVELNGPLFAAGMLVAGIWMSELNTFAASGRRFDSLSPRVLVYSSLGLLVAALPLIIYLPVCFSMADPYYARWEAQIAEEQPILLQEYIVQNWFLFAAVIAALAALSLRWKSLSAGMRAAFLLTAGLALVYGYFGVSSLRFTEIALACLCLVVALNLPSRAFDGAAGFAAAFLVLTGFHALHTSAVQTVSTIRYGEPAAFSPATNLRLVSGQLLKLDDKVQGGVLTLTYEANVINYFTRLPVYGTAYWDNEDGLYFTHSLLFSEQPDGVEGWTEVRRRMHSARVARIVIPKEMSYASSYMIYAEDRITDPSHCFAYYLIHTDKEKLPAWLKLERDDEKYRIFTVIDAL